MGRKILNVSLTNPSSGSLQPNQRALTSLKESFTDIETEYKYYPWAPGSFQLVVDGKIFIFVTILRIPYLSERI